MPHIIKVKAPLPSTILMFLVLLVTIAFPSLKSIRGLLFIFFGVYLLFMMIIRHRSVRWIHLLWAGGFYLLSILSRRWSIYPSGAEEVIGNVTFAMLLSWCFGEYIYHANREINHLCAIMAVVAVLMSLNFVLNSTLVDGRYTLDINANIVGMNAAFLFGVMLYGAKEARWQKLHFNLLAVVVAFVAILTGSRKALLMMVLYVVAFAFFWRPERNMARFLVKVIVSVGIGAVVIILLMKVDVLYDIIGNRLESLYMQWVMGEETDASAFSRSRMIDIGLNIFSKKPWIGFGHNAFKLGSGYETYSHNNYVELLCSLGIVGIVVYYLPMLYFTIEAILLWRRGVPGAILPLSIFIIQYINDIGQVSYYSFNSSIFLGIAVGYVYLLNKKYKQGVYDDLIIHRRRLKR